RSLLNVVLARHLDLSTVNGASITVTGNLLLQNGVVHLGQSTGFQFGQLNFSSAGSQVLDAVPGSTGTIDLGLSGNNGISFNGSVTGDQFTIGAAITVQGTAGFINTSSSFRLDNKGTITADPTIFGTTEGTVSETESTVNLGGTFTMVALGTLTRVGGVTHGTVNLTGTLNNSDQTMLFNDVTGSWILQGGAVSGGTLAATAGRALVASSGTLAGVTLDNSAGNASPLDLTVVNGGSATLTGGLLL